MSETTYKQIMDGLGKLTDQELIELTKQAYKDTQEAEQNSEWHGSCFAALVLFSKELSNRDLKITSP